MNGENIDRGPEGPDLFEPWRKRCPHAGYMLSHRMVRVDMAEIHGHVVNQTFRNDLLGRCQTLVSRQASLEIL